MVEHEDMSRVLGQGSTAIGDLIMSSHVLYDLHTKGHEVSVAIPKETPAHNRELYSKHTYLKNVIEMDDISRVPFLSYCATNGYEPVLHVEATNVYKHVTFHPLKQWFQHDTQSTVSGNKLVGFHVTSSTNFSRPSVPALWVYIEHIINSGHQPVFIGTEKDEALFHELYPGYREKYKVPDEYWRFGKDTVLQTLANVGTFTGMIVFSSWTTHAAVLQGVPTIELWSDVQWQVYNPVVYHMMGCPVHYCQVSCWDSPSPYLGNQILQRMKDLATVFYGGF